MKTLASLGVLVVLAILATTAPAAIASPEAAGGIRVTVDHSTLRSGETLTVTARSSSACVWLIEWNAERRSAAGKRIIAAFVAPEVSRPTRLPVGATCFSTAKAPAPRTRPAPPVQPNSITERITVAVPASLHQTITVTVAPPTAIVSPPEQGGGGHGSDLPDTGGPDLWILLAGIATLLAGASLIRLAESEEPALSR